MTDDDDAGLGEPPNDVDAERWLLGAMMTGPAAIEAAVEILEPGHFYRPAHQVLYGAMVAMFAAGTRIDPVTLRAELQANNETRVLGSQGALYLAELFQLPSVQASAGHYANTILDTAARRALLTASWRLQRDVSDLSTPAMRLLEDAQEALGQVMSTAAGQTTRAKTHAECMEEPDPPGGRWLIPGLIRPGERVVAVGPEGAGKSYLALQVAYAAASGVHPFIWDRRYPPIRVLVIDLENPNAIVLERMRLFGGIAATYSDEWDDGNLFMHRQPGGADLSDPREAAALAAIVRRCEPDLIVAGPVYKLVGSDEGERMVTAHRKVAAFFDRLRERHDCAIWLEAHTPYGARSENSYRPEGSNIWSKWPEFGVTLKHATEQHGGKEGLDVGSYRGDRTGNRHWPSWIVRNHLGGWPWMANFKNGIPKPPDGDDYDPAAAVAAFTRGVGDDE